MKVPNKNVTSDLGKILSKVVQEKIYGSVEIFFEAGEVTQITQRIINKVKTIKSTPPPSFKKVVSSSKKPRNVDIDYPVKSPV